MNENPGKKLSLNHVFTNGEMFLLSLGVAVIGNVLYQLAPGFLLSCLAILGDVMVLMSVGRWMYERVRRRGRASQVSNQVTQLGNQDAFNRPEYSVRREVRRATPGEMLAGGAGRVIGWVIGFGVASALVGGVVSWWNDNHWSSAGESAFLSSCEAQPGASVSYCGCALGQVEQHYGPKQAGEILTSNPSVVNTIAGYCVGQ